MKRMRLLVPSGTNGPVIQRELIVDLSSDQVPENNFTASLVTNNGG